MPNTKLLPTHVVEDDHQDLVPVIKPTSFASPYPPIPLYYLFLTEGQSCYIDISDQHHHKLQMMLPSLLKTR